MIHFIVSGRPREVEDIEIGEGLEREERRGTLVIKGRTACSRIIAPVYPRCEGCCCPLHGFWSINRIPRSLARFVSRLGGAARFSLGRNALVSFSGDALFVLEKKDWCRDASLAATCFRCFPPSFESRLIAVRRRSISFPLRSSCLRHSYRIYLTCCAFCRRRGAIGMRVYSVSRRSVGVPLTPQARTSVEQVFACLVVRGCLSCVQYLVERLAR